MLKKFVIFGLVLLLGGSAELGWTLVQRKKELLEAASFKLKYASEPDEYLKKYNEWLKLPPEERTGVPFVLSEPGNGKTRAQQKQEQQERLRADLDKLATGEMVPHPFADVLYGENWREELRRYKQRKERSEFVFTGSVVCTSIGGTISVWCFLAWLCRRLVGGSAVLQRLFSRVSARRAVADNVPAKAAVEIGAKDSTEEQEVKERDGQIQKRARIPLSSGRSSSHSEPSNGRNTTAAQAGAFAKSQAGSDKGGHVEQKRHPEKLALENSEKINVLLSDQKSGENEPRPKVAAKSAGVNFGQDVIVGQKANKPALSGSGQQTPKLEDSLRTQTENLEKQMAEFKQMAQNVKETTLEHSKPLNKALEELTQQVSAIREYASYQQERVEKLQDGYDWNIIRTFCLRVIRCIDNLENRIDLLSKQNMDSGDLEEVKDELIFALESSGIEQFRPEINSEYRGQEKFAEAVKAKEHCDDMSRVGRIAKVIRPGYQYFINEDNVKVVRTAQVKLFG
ncbi:MAG: hypothetical protein JSU94_07415 [Phycisphaerales bacterium]|nr:MAG: hypothetical protein JSU94_07415 [Phycisphaerales bacterium]